MRSVLIHSVVLVLWALLFAMAFRYTGLLAWSTGVAYVAYDTLLLGFVFWQTLSLAKNQRLEPEPAAADLPTARVTLGMVVAAHNEAAVLPLTLAALLGQTDAPDQIVVADDGSTDATPDVMLRLYGLAVPPLGVMSAASPTYPTLRWLRLPHGGKATALNAAIVQMDTETVLTVDGDTLLEADAIGAMQRAFSKEPALVAATGVLAPVCRPTLGGRL